MLKKFSLCILCCVLLFVCGCSRENKFGVEQFVERMNDNYGTDYSTSEFMLSEKNGENILFLTRESNMITLLLDKDNNIKGISLLITADGNIENAKKTYCQMCSVFTGNNYENQLKTLNDSEFLSEKIKFADDNSVITVGRYKYTIASNSYAITFFCDKI